MGFFNIFSSKKKDKEDLNKSLNKTKESFISKFSKAVVGKDTIDEEVLDNIEESLISADIGIETTIKIINRLEERVRKDKYLNSSDLNKILKEEISQLLDISNSKQNIIPETGKYPYVMLVVGVNGVGKTTTIGKLATLFKKHGKSVILGAADTFRAAAVDQIELWGKRVDVPVISHGMNTDPASVAYDAVKKAVDENYDAVIIDTAGRLHNKVGLMNELGKIKRIIQKFIPEAPHDILLVLDGSTGQNAFIQVKEFKKVTDVSAIAVTKLDGTAKGGIIIGICSEFNIPIKYIGLGEKPEDLQIFNTTNFIETLFD
ncbi:MAG: signal recognition particle-docking protein FtsY [Bacteroidetes bacterium]|nr:signal recognition particle-docking protein FtsY [Bacteroidota bacterium]